MVLVFFLLSLPGPALYPQTKDIWPQVLTYRLHCSSLLGLPLGSLITIVKWLNQKKELQWGL